MYAIRSYYVCGEALENPQAVSQAMHKTLEAERATEASKNKLHERKLSLESQIRRLQNVGGAADEGLLRIAEQLVITSYSIHYTKLYERAGTAEVRPG